MRAKQKTRFQKSCFKMKMNTKHTSNRIIIKTITKFLKNADNTQNTADYIEREIKGSSSKSINTRIQQIKYKYQRKKNWTIPLLLESPNSKYFQSTGLEVDFLLDSGAESTTINIRT